MSAQHAHHAEDAYHMAQAVRLAVRGLGLAWPNPSVGSVVVMPSGEIAGRGWTAPGGRPHAEAIALEQAGAKAEGSTVYVTVEPCAHESVRGMACTDALLEARPKRVVIGLRDPDTRTAGAGIDRLRAAGIEVAEGVLAEDVARVTIGHLMRVAEGRPAVTLKLAVGADGLMPEGHGKPTWITGTDARAHAHLLRSRHDVILVGRGTVINDNPALTCRLPGMSCRSPIRVVLDGRLRTPPDATLFEDIMVPVWLLCAAGIEHPNSGLLHDLGAEIVPVPVDDHGRIEVQDALETLSHRGVTSVLVEGGPTVARAFLDADFVDEAVVYQGGKPAGRDGLTPFAGDGLDRLTASDHFVVSATRSFGPDRMTLWRRVRSCLQALSAA